MHFRPLPALFFSCALVGTALAAAAPGAARPALASDAVRRLFAEPPAEYTSAPLWVWNDLLTEEQIRTSLRELAEQGVKQAFVHPRPGLMTPYLSADWFRLWKVALHEAERLGMLIWIYDENSYPSGFAGGAVPEVMPASRGLGLTIAETAKPPVWKDDLLAVHRLDGARLEPVTEAVRAGRALPAGRYATVTRQLAAPGPWYANRTYVNLLTPGVTTKFLELTLEPYRRELGAALGARVPGIFTDEPHLRPAGELPWCDDLPERFQQRWGYALLDHLPALALDVGDARRLRYHYYRLLNELFIERWARPYYDACTALGLEFTGHYWEHTWPRTNSVPDNLAMAAWQHRPGIDILMNDYAEGPNAQFGNARVVREIASIANQLGRARNLCELYGAGGWDLRFEDMKRIGDWLLALGCNTINEHLTYISLRGGRKRDHPQSFSYHAPWWRDYRHVATRFARLTAALSQGRQVNRVLVLAPTTTAWMYNAGRRASERLDALGRDFQDLINALEAAQVGYDLGSEDVLARWGSVAERQLVVGAARYEVVVLPAQMESLDAETLGLLERLLATGGTVVSLGAQPPALLDGAPSPRAAALARASGWKSLGELEAVSWLAARDADRFAVRRAPGDRGLLFHHRRKLPDGELLFLVNTSLQHASAGRLQVAARQLERWNPEDGTFASYPARPDVPAGTIEADYLLPPAGSLLLFLAATPGPLPAAGESPGAAAPVVVRTLPPRGAIEIARAEPNVLTLDYVDVAAGGEKRENIYFFQAAQFVFQRHGLKGNPWESAVQYQDEILRRPAAPDSGFEAGYRFTIEQPVPGDLELVLERADLLTVTCNGRPVAPQPGAWWLDRAFGVVPLGEAARVGENIVTVRARPLTHFHELEPAYLRGSFRLRPAREGFVVVPDAPLVTGAWRDQGHPFYAAGVVYRQTFEVPAPLAGTYAVALTAWHGSVARVRVNGVAAGIVAWAPWTCDVTSGLLPGRNTIEVEVVGTLKNTLGPHHGNPPLGRAWPAGVRAAPKAGRAAGTEYSTVGYGLFAPFVLQQSRPAGR